MYITIKMHLHLKTIWYVNFRIKIYKKHFQKKNKFNKYKHQAKQKKRIHILACHLKNPISKNSRTQKSVTRNNWIRRSKTQKREAKTLTGMKNIRHGNLWYDPTHTDLSSYFVACPSFCVLGGDILRKDGSYMI